MEQTTKATIYGLISNLEKYTIEDAKRILFQMAQDMDRAYDTQVRDLRRKAEVFDQLDAYGCNSAGAWLDIVDENRRLKESAAAPQVGGEGIGEDEIEKRVSEYCAAHEWNGSRPETINAREIGYRNGLKDGIELCRSHGLLSPADPATNEEIDQTLFVVQEVLPYAKGNNGEKWDEQVDAVARKVYALRHRIGRDVLALTPPLPAPSPGAADQLVKAGEAKSIVVQWLETPGDKNYAKTMYVVKSDHHRFVDGSRFDYGFMSVATDQGYRVTVLPLSRPEVGQNEQDR